MKRASVLIQLVLFAATVEAAMVADDRVFESGSGRACFVDLLRESAWGLAGNLERAAFVVDQGDGSLSCVHWRPTRHYLSETFQGVIPPHTVAIAHTHPADLPLPSVQDRFEASRLGLPIYTITLRAVYRADPDQDEVATIIRGRIWIYLPTRLPPAAAP